MLAASGPIGPMLMSGTGTIMPPAITARSFTVIEGRNWKVMSSHRIGVVVDVDLVDRVGVEA